MHWAVDIKPIALTVTNTCAHIHKHTYAHTRKQNIQLHVTVKIDKQGNSTVLFSYFVFFLFITLLWFDLIRVWNRRYQIWYSNFIFIVVTFILELSFSSESVIWTQLFTPNKHRPSVFVFCCAISARDPCLILRVSALVYFRTGCPKSTLMTSNERETLK